MKNKVVLDVNQIEEIVRKCLFCNVSMVDENNMPYVVPMNFGFHSGVVFLHSSKVGKKMDILKRNNQVCISFSTDHELRWQSEQVACSYSMKYRSVLVYGRVEFVEKPNEKIEALNCIMQHYTEREFTYSEPAVREVAVYRVAIDKMDGRVYGY